MTWAQYFAEFTTRWYIDANHLGGVVQMPTYVSPQDGINYFKSRLWISKGLYLLTDIVTIIRTIYVIETRSNFRIYRVYIIDFLAWEHG